MRIFKTTLVVGCTTICLGLSSIAVSQSEPDVIDSFPRKVMEARAAKRAAEAAKARAEALESVSTEGAETSVSEPALTEPVESEVTVSVTKDAGKPVVSASAGPITAGSSPEGIDMVIINPGSGKLGSPDTEEKRARFENPLRETKINYRFEVSKYEITFDDWNKCVSGGGCAGHKPDDKEWGRGKRPVINVSYDDAQNFLKWLNQKTGENYRLLSEAEWEYVARAGQDGPFGTGADMSAEFANFDGSAPYGSGSEGPYFRKTRPVGQYEPNAFGIYDMHGNVYEWVEDCWNADHQGSTVDGSPRKDGDCKFRVMKGGSWVTHGYQTRAAARIRYVTDYRYDDYGIRIARTLN